MRKKFKLFEAPKVTEGAGLKCWGSIRDVNIKEHDITTIVSEGLYRFPSEEEIRTWRVVNERGNYRIPPVKGALSFITPVAYDDIDLFISDSELKPLIIMNVRVYCIFRFYYSEEDPSRLYWNIIRPSIVQNVMTRNHKWTSPPIVVSIDADGLTGDIEISSRYSHKETIDILHTFLTTPQVQILDHTRAEIKRVSCWALHKSVPHGIGFFEFDSDAKMDGNGCNFPFTANNTRNSKVRVLPPRVKISVCRI